jgi:hypothetical protein
VDAGPLELIARASVQVAAAMDTCRRIIARAETKRVNRGLVFEGRCPGDRFTVPLNHQDPSMNMFISIGPLAALIAGILILILPRLLNYIVAIYLILIGVIGLFGSHL